MGRDTEQTETTEALLQIVREQNLMLLRAQDREIGLEQELNTLRAGHNREHLVRELAEVKGSASFKIGRFLTAPFRFIGFVWATFIRVSLGIARRLKRKLQKR